MPLVEAFFVMCDARAVSQTQPSSPLQPALSAELSPAATPGPSAMEAAPQQTPQQTPSSRQHAHGGASGPSQPVAEPAVPFLRCHHAVLQHGLHCHVLCLAFPLCAVSAYTMRLVCHASSLQRAREHSRQSAHPCSPLLVFWQLALHGTK